MTLLARTIRAMPWLPWLPVAVLVGFIGWSIDGFPPDFASRHLYLRSGMMAIGLGLAFVFDDPAAETTDPAPVSLRLRRAIRVIVGLAVWLCLAIALFVLGARGMNVVFIYDPELTAALPLGRLLLEGLTMAAFGLAIAAVISKRWDDEPGKIASAGLLVLYAASWTIPEHWKPWADPSDARWTTSHPWWWAGLAIAVLVVLTLSWDARVGWSSGRLTRRRAGITRSAVGTGPKKESARIRVDQ